MRGVETADAEIDGVSSKMIGPASQAIEEQINELESLITGELIDGVVIECADQEPLRQIFDMAWERGIPALAHDADAPETSRLAYVGVVNQDLGAEGGKAIVKLHPEKTGKFAQFAAYPEGAYARDRLEGLWSVLDE